MIDRTYYRANEGDDNPVSNALKGVAVAGAAGMIMAYQPWGKRATRFLGRVVDTTKRTLKSMESIRQGAGIRHYTKSDFRQLYSDIQTNWASSEAVVDRLALNKDNNGSLAAYIQSVEVTVAQARERAREVWIRDYLQQDAVDELLQQNFDRATTDNVRSFLNKAVQNAANYARNMEIARQHKLKDDALDFADYAARRIQQRYNQAIGSGTGSDADIIAKIENSVKTEIQKSAYNLETIERALGTARKPDIATEAVQILSHAHKMTWKEAKNLGATLKDDSFIAGSKRISVKAKMQEIEDIILDKGGNEAYDRLMQVTIDESNLFMTHDGNAFSKETSGSLWRSFLGAARNTLPGKLFKIGDIDNALKMPAVQMISLSARDDVFRAKLRKIGEEDKYHFRIGKDIFTLDIDAQQGAQVSFNQQLNNGDIKFVSGRYGFYHTQLEALAGRTKMVPSNNWLFSKLDVFQDREEYTGSVVTDKLSMFIGENQRQQRFGEQLKMSPEYSQRWASAIADLHSFAHNANPDFRTDLSEETKDFVLEYMETAKKISEIFRTSTYHPIKGIVEELLQSPVLNQESRKLFELLLEDNTQKMTEHFVGRGAPGLLNVRTSAATMPVDYLNNDLQILIKGVMNNPDVTRNRIDLVTNELRLSYGSDFINLFRTPMTNTTYTYNDIIRREIAKEALLRQGLDTSVPGEVKVHYDQINELLQSVDLSERNAKEIDKLAQFSIWQHFTGVNKRPAIDNAMYLDYMQKMDRTDELLRGTNDVAKKFQDTYRTVMGDEISWLEEEAADAVAGVDKLEEYVAVNRAASPLDIVKGLAKSILERDTSLIKKEISNVIGGLTANREDMSQANLWTFVPFFTMKRLSDELNKVGLGFSSDSMKSTGNLAAAFMFKRVLPIAVGATYLDWSDDISKRATGTGLWEAFTSDVANVDLAGRRVISNLGLDEWLKQTKSVNPIWQYWGDKDDYQGYEERKEYYEEGYVPVRKAAWSVGHAA